MDTGLSHHTEKLGINEPISCTDNSIRVALEQHWLWLVSEGKAGTPADFTRCNLEGKDLQGANLEGVALDEANLQGANLKAANLRYCSLVKTNLRKANLTASCLYSAKLRHTNLEGANLSEANLVNADLCDAKLKYATLSHASFAGSTPGTGANLERADLRYTILQDANLHYSKGLCAKGLAGANLSGAKLPAYLGSFQGLIQIKEISQIARPINLLIILLCLYSSSSILSTTDFSVITNAESQVLPSINTRISTRDFFISIPLVLCFLFTYFHCYINLLSKEINNLPLMFQDGSSRESYIFPWSIVQGLSILQNNSITKRMTVVLASLFMGWLYTPIVILLFWWRYLVAQNFTITIIHALLLLFTIYICFISIKKSTNTFEVEASIEKTVMPFILSKVYIVVLGILIFLVSSIVTLDLRGKYIDKVAGSISKLLFVTANFEGEDLTKKDFQNCSLRKSNFRRAILVETKFRRADLRRADFFCAKLNGANLSGALLSEADLSNANLQNAILLIEDYSEAKLCNTTLPSGIVSNRDCPSNEISPSFGSCK